VDSGFEPQSYYWKDITTGTWTINSTSKSGQINQLQAVLNDISHRLRMDGAISSRHSVPIVRRRGVILPKDYIDFSQPGLDGLTVLLEVGKSAIRKIKQLSAEVRDS
jgi:hypothetical protein